MAARVEKGEADGKQTGQAWRTLAQGLPEGGRDGARRRGAPRGRWLLRGRAKWWRDRVVLHGPSDESGTTQKLIDKFNAKKPSGAGGLDGLRTLEIVLAAYRSGRDHEPKTVERT